jgi:hypothetical protein
LWLCGIKDNAVWKEFKGVTNMGDKKNSKREEWEAGFIYSQEKSNSIYTKTQKPTFLRLY